MAIDTEDKRRSTQGVWATTRVLPVPDGSINAGDREHVWLYRGIAVGGVVVPTVFERRHVRRGGFRKRG